jgi:tellurite resistance protein
VAADGSISATESATLDEIASELDIERDEAAPVRAEFADRLSARLSFRPPQ